MIGCRTDIVKADVTQSGVLGTCTWEYDGSTKVLTIRPTNNTYGEGWQSKDQSNPSGVIPANGTVDSVFTNEYVPGTATISLIAQKTLDGRIPVDGQFSFELLEDGEVIDTVSNNAAGMVTFETLVFKTPNTYTYQIREIRGEDKSINYDSHVETVTITVTDDGKGNLTATSSQGDTILTFENETKQGSLSFSKEAEGEGTFTFEITLTDDFGRPLDGISVVE
jgi:pilin isopeptide linkage protein